MMTASGDVTRVLAELDRGNPEALALGRRLGGNPLRQSVALYEQRMPASELRTARAQSELGGCLTALGQFDEAERLLLESSWVINDGDRRRPILAPEMLQRITDLYEAWGQPEEAAPSLEMENRL